MNWATRSAAPPPFASRSRCPSSASTSWNFASCGPCDPSSTVSWSGQRVAAMRRRRSTSCSSGTLMRKGRIASPQRLQQAAAGSRLATPAAAAAGQKAAPVRRCCGHDFLRGRAACNHRFCRPALWRCRRCSPLTGRTLTPARRELPVMRCEALLALAEAGLRALRACSKASLCSKGPVAVFLRQAGLRNRGA